MKVEILRYDWQRATAWELMILQYSAEGMTSRQIADSLNRSVRTIENQRQALCKRIRAKNVTHAVTMAFKAGVLK